MKFTFGSRENLRKKYPREKLKIKKKIFIFNKLFSYILFTFIYFFNVKIK